MIQEYISPPAASPECHASTLIALPDESLLLAWFSGEKEGCGDVAIWGARYNKSGWSEPFQLVKVNNQPHWNPVLHRHGNEITLFFKTGRDCKYWRTFVMRSTDAGKSWSKAEELVPGNLGGRGPVKNKCIELSDGALLAPASSEIGRWQAFTDRSEDCGHSWERSKLISQSKRNIGQSKSGEDIPFGVIQPALWESKPGIVHMLLRSNCGKICRSDSNDGGHTWCRIYETALDNNNSGIDLVKLKDGRLLLVHNPVSGNWAKRSPLTLSVSLDNGMSWKKVRDLETEDYEFSYPAIIELENGGVAMSYTCKRRKIGLAILSGKEVASIK